MIFPNPENPNQYHTMKSKLALILLALLPACSHTGTVQLAESAAAPKVKPYPLKTCIVTDNALGSMGDEQRIVHNGQEIKFCCKPCIAKFKKNPEKYLAKLR